MGAPTLEASLRARLLAFVAPLFVAVGVASLALTSRALDVIDTDAARTRAEAALRMLQTEEAEGDDPELALKEVLLAADADGVRIVLRFGNPPKEMSGAHAVPATLGALPRGVCGTASDDDGASWRGCAVRAGDLEAIVAVPMEAHRAALRNLALSMIGVLAAALLATLVIARVAVRRPLASLKALVGWSEHVVASDAKAPPPPRGDATEVARLAASFEDVLRRLFDALERERANSAHIAHELRTPLTGMRGELDALAARSLAVAERDAVARLAGDVARMSDVIDAILALSSPRDAKSATAVVNLADVVRETTPQGTTVEAPDEALIEGDARLIDLALRNLLDNATKHGGRAEAVRVRKASNGGVELTVTDDGPGLDERARAHMFERYWRGSANGDGAGLGLALVRVVAERHGGGAEARVNPTGRGLEIAMTFAPLLEWHEAERVSEGSGR
jgi:two-component system OmpR family sensor kinase